MMLKTRRAVLGDLDLLVPLFDGYRQFYDQPSQPIVCRDFLRARFERGESVVFLVENGAGAIGFVQLYPLFSSVRVRPVWLLNDLYVLPAQRGIGAGRTLLDAATEHARSNGAAYLMLETTAENTYAHAVYERYGYNRIDPQSRFYLLDLG